MGLDHVRICKGRARSDKVDRGFGFDDEEGVGVAGGAKLCAGFVEPSARYFLEAIQNNLTASAQSILAIP